MSVRLAVTWRTGVVVEILADSPEVREVRVRVRDLGDGQEYRALAYRAIVGTPKVHDRVLITTDPVDRGLGTGGLALVAALPDHPPQAEPSIHHSPADRIDISDSLGHLVKARYTPTQVMVRGVDEPGSEHHSLLRDADDIAGMPVVVADLHSALPAVLCGIRTQRADAVVAYVLTDGGALPAWYSRTVAGLREAGWLAGCISTGQAFGGDVEAVTVHTGLLAARLVLNADIAVVSQGPGNLGTGTRWGFSGVAAGEAVNAAGVLGGRPVASLRMSQADPRPRHRGISHHSMTAYGRVAWHSADVVLPQGETETNVQMREQVDALIHPRGRHRLVEVPQEGLLQALAESPVTLSTMGRGLSQDPLAFIAAAAAGAHAAYLIRA
ncbi:MAG: DUF3866 family protein [Actinomycetota bacterium]